MEALTEAQTAELRADLLALQREIEAAVAASKEGSRPVDLDEPIGRVSRVDAMQQQSMVAANRSAALRRRQQVAAALERIAQDDYGACPSCGEWIGYPRLKAQPEAPLCVRCQSRREERR